MCIQSPFWPVMALAALLPACNIDSPMSELRRSPLVQFEELFAAHDTIRLEPSVIIGTIDFLDINPNGELLISDFMGRGIHRFAPSGNHVNSYSTEECLPDDPGFAPMSSRFIGSGKVMTIQFGGAAAVFEADGSCIAATRRLEAGSRAICAHNDSIFVHRVYVEDMASIGAYTPDLGVLDDMEIEPPRFIRLNGFFQGQLGRSIECFDDGPYYIYAENIDAESVRSPGTRFEADFAEVRPVDLPEGGYEAMSEAQIEYPSAVAVFAIDGSTRMTVFNEIDRQWIPAGTHPRSAVGLNIASNKGQFPGRSTVAAVYPRAAADGFMYVTGPNEYLEDGAIGNPIIVRYRFKYPAATDY